MKRSTILKGSAVSSCSAEKEFRDVKRGDVTVDVSLAASSADRVYGLYINKATSIYFSIGRVDILWATCSL